MREIKFRGCQWNADNELLPFVYGKLCDVDIIRTIKGVDKVVHYKTVGQFTGLFDKTGKEIYEGDICNFIDHPTNIESCVADVKFSDGNFVDNYMGWTINSYGSEWTEIIGNIHESPELLK